MTFLTSALVWNFSLIFTLSLIVTSCGVKAPPKSKTSALPSIESPYVDLKKVEAKEDVEKEEN